MKALLCGKPDLAKIIANKMTSLRELEDISMGLSKRSLRFDSVMKAKWDGFGRKIVENAVLRALSEANSAGIHHDSFHQAYWRSLYQNAQNRTAPPVLPAELTLNRNSRVLCSVTKEALYQSDGGLRNVIGHLKHQPRTMGKNKAKVFEYGLSEMKGLVDTNPRYRAERTDVIQQPYPRNSAGIFNRPISLGRRPKTTFSGRWMDYSNQFGGNPPRRGYSTTFVDFANNRVGGGCFNPKRGDVQEEQLVRRCPELAILLGHFNPSRHHHQLHTRTPIDGDQEQGKYAHAGSANPLLFTNLRFLLGQGDEAAKTTDIKSRQNYDASLAYRTVPNAPPVNVVAVAAPELRNQDRGMPYSMRLIRDFYGNAFSAFELAKSHDQTSGKRTQIVTGRLGAGAFGHNLNMSTALQYLAARLAGVDDIKFTGIDAATAAELGNTVFSWVDRKIEEASRNGETAEDILQDLSTYSREQGWVTAA